MKTFSEFQKHFGAKKHYITDPVTHRQIRVPKGYSIPVSRSGSKGNGSDGSGNGGSGDGN